jgi:putative hydrolase of the HAD superfamily
MKFTSVAFDLDGTLYPNYGLNVRLVPFILKDHRLLRAMDKARKILRRAGAGFKDFDGDFYDLQAKLMGEILDMPVEKVKEMTERLIYRGWEPLFKKIKLFPHVRETLETFRKKGIKLGLLSDFPPEIKLENLKVKDFWHTVLSSEQTGRLKPDPAPFLELARRMDTPKEQILYVGNSVPYDVEGARNAGMKAALILHRWKKRPKTEVSASDPNFVFYDYRQLCDYVLN